MGRIEPAVSLNGISMNVARSAGPALVIVEYEIDPADVDREVQSKASAFHGGAEPPRVRHFIHERISEVD